MRCAVVLALVAALAVGCTARAASKKHVPPVWPKTYSVSFNLTMPYIDSYQPGTNFTYVYQVWQDEKNVNQKVVRNDVEIVLSRADQDKRYNIYPHKDRWGCWTAPLGGGGAGPTVMGTAEAVPMKGGAAGAGLRVESLTVASHAEKVKELTFVLPDLHEKRWVFKGHEHVHGKKADLYEWDLTEDKMEMTYKMYVEHGTGVPLQLWQLGANLLTGGHKDLYVSDYYDFAPGNVSASDFEVPEWGNCDTPDFAGSPNDLAALFSRHMPPQHWGDEAYDRFVHAHRRRHAHAGEYAARRAEFHSNRAYIAAWNENVNRTHDLGVNRFADWTRAEYEAAVLPRAGTARRLAADHPDTARHVRSVDAGMVPSALSWVGTPADSPVKDQGACGSCWTFSTVAPYESALFRLTGEQTLLSEQNLLDCNWMETNHGCFGGEQMAGMDWIFANGGLARMSDYPYVGVNSWCRDDAPKVGFSGKRVLVEGGRPDLVMEALYSKGPLTVSVDASADSFRFYSGGVYHNPECKTRADELDHAVILSAYGTTEDGQDYWLIKNMWSTYWGEGGYMKIPRNGNDCGIAAEPIYVDLELK